MDAAIFIDEEEYSCLGKQGGSNKYGEYDFFGELVYGQ